MNTKAGRPGPRPEPHFPRRPGPGMIPPAGLEQHGAHGGAMNVTTRPAAPSLRDAQAVAELFVGVIRRDVLGFYPHSRFEPLSSGSCLLNLQGGPDFHLFERAGEGGDSVLIEVFGVPYLLSPKPGSRFTADDVRMIRAIG